MIVTGASWPPASCEERIKGYVDFERLYDGEHSKVSSISHNLNRRLREQGPDAITYLVQDFPRLIVDIPTDLLVSKPPVVSYPAGTPEADALAEVFRRSRWQKVLLECVQDTSALGDGVLVATGRMGSVRIEAKPAYCYFPTVSPDNVKEAIGEALAWEREYNGDTVIRVDHYHHGRIDREAWLLDGTKISNRLPDEDVIEMAGAVTVRTGLSDRNTLVHVANNPSSSDYFGRSDLGGGLVTLFDEANERASQIARILDKHASPKMAGPRLHLDAEGRQRLQDYFETVDGTAPRYITWDAQLQAAFQHLDRVKENIFAFARVAEALAYLVQGARYDSAPAAQMQFAQTLAKVARKRMYFDYAIKEICRIAVAIELGQTYEDTPEPGIRWRDGLPKDLSQDAMTEEIRLRSGTTSRIDAIQRLDDCDEATARNTIGETLAFGIPYTPKYFSSDAEVVLDQNQDLGGRTFSESEETA